MFTLLQKINHRPKPFQYYTAEELWTNDYTSKKMLSFHLDESIDVSSRNFKFIENSIEWVTSHFNVNHSTKICDFGCGPGLYTSHFAEKGAQVTGIDFSPRSIKYAKKSAQKTGQQINYVLQNYLSYDTDTRFDLICMIMCDFCALSPKQRKTLLKTFYNLLKSNGSILLDVYTTNSFDKRAEQSAYEKNMLNGFWSPDDYYCFLNTFKYDKEKVVLDKYTIIEKNRVRVVYNWLQFYSRESLVAEIQENNLKVEEFFSDVCGSKFNQESDEMAIIAKRAI
jgi:cyclopropane fatty-acyl-phospholipid synthase-like methyltransferase